VIAEILFLVEQIRSRGS
jgi:hypothetical protein